MAVRAPSQELYSALFSGEAMKKALQWDESTPRSGPTDSWRTESRDEYRGHRWVTRFPSWAPTSAAEPHGDLGSTIPNLQLTDRKETQQQQQKQQHEKRNCCCCCSCCCKHPHRMEGMSLPTQQQEQREQKQQRKPCLTHCQATRVRQQQQQQQQQQQLQQRQLLRGYLPSRGGLGRRRNEALLQRVGGGYQLYGPISWSSFKAVDAQTNTPVDAARHAATQTAADAAAEALATPGGPTQAAAAASDRQVPKRKAARWFPRQQRCVSSEAFVADRMSPPYASNSAPYHGGLSSCSSSSSCCCCCCCRGSQDAEAHVAAAGPQCCCCPPSTARPAAVAATVHASAAKGMPTVILEPRENIRAATASARRCRSTGVRDCRPQQQQQQRQHQPQQQDMQLRVSACSCRETSRGPPLASSRVSGGAQRNFVFEASEGGLQPVQPGGPPSVLQGYAGLLSGALRRPATQSQQTVRRTASST
ncbi:hypothetical protein Emed_005030 [Eimeria media]